MEVWPGRPWPAGATWNGEGTNFALSSGAAERVELCLEDGAGARTEVRLPLEQGSGGVWHGFVPGAGPGTRYGFRVHGPFRPHAGLRANPAKLLIDPCARALSGELVWHDAVSGSVPGQDEVPDPRDSSPYVPRSVVVDPNFAWGDDAPPSHPWNDTVVLELHVKGFTARHPRVPEHLRGTYAGLGHPAAVEELVDLGVNAVELLPVQHHVTERALARRGLTNYWGYNPLGWSAPHAAYSSAGDGGGQVAEFKAMVAALHAAGIEVLLDVVYNHTCESNRTGPTVCLRGIDNPAYYRLVHGNRAEYVDHTGTGNTVNLASEATLRLVMDSLRYWVTDMHVDGFRFDLAATMGRGASDAFDPRSTFFQAVSQDPVLSRVKLLAEPWDLGPGGYQVGHFPHPWGEWNGRYRDTVRDFWRGRVAPLAEMGFRLTGSHDLYGGRGPWASANFVTCHDGFTLHDLVSYEHKRNQANGEDNRDGTDDNRSQNCGVEGETDDPAVLALRARRQRNFLATLLLSQGVPLLTAGDERNRTQLGNNNAYCHDSELTWIDWSTTEADAELRAFVRKLTALRREQPVFRRRRFLRGRADGAPPDVGWFTPLGREMTEGDWTSPLAVGLGMFLDGGTIEEPGPRGEPVVGDSFLLLLNPSSARAFRLPFKAWGARYEVVLDTGGRLEGTTAWAQQELELEASSLVLLRRIS